MQRRANINTTTYDAGDGFMVDIVECFAGKNDEEEIYEAWLYMRDYGIKKSMYGMACNRISKEDFVNMVSDDVDEYKEYYWETVEELEIE